MVVAILGCGNSAFCISERHPIIPVLEVYQGAIGSKIPRNFTVKVNPKKNVTGTYSDGKKDIQINGSVKDNTLSAYGSNGDFWGGEINGNTLFIVVRSAAGNTNGNGTLVTSPY